MPRRPPEEAKYALLQRMLERPLDDPFPKGKRERDITALMAKSEKNSSSYFPESSFTKGEMDSLLENINTEFSKRYKGRKGEKIQDTISLNKLEITDLKREGKDPPTKTYLHILEDEIQAINGLREILKETVSNAGIEGPKAAKVIEAAGESPEMAADLAFAADVGTNPRSLDHLNAALRRHYTVHAAPTYTQSRYTEMPDKKGYIDTVGKLLAKTPHGTSKEEKARIAAPLSLLEGAAVLRWKIIETSPFQMDCLIHSFLTATCEAFQRMPHLDERNRAASALRRIVLTNLIGEAAGIPGLPDRKSVV